MKRLTFVCFTFFYSSLTFANEGLVKDFSRIENGLAKINSLSEKSNSVEKSSFEIELNKVFLKLVQKQLLFRHELNNAIRPQWENWKKTQEEEYLVSLKNEIHKAVLKVSLLKISNAEKNEIRKDISSLVNFVSDTEKNFPQNEVQSLVKDIAKDVQTLKAKVNKIFQTQPVRTVPQIQAAKVVPATRSALDYVWLGFFTLIGSALTFFGTRFFFTRRMKKMNKKVRVTHDLVLKKLKYPVICLMKGRPLYVNPSAEGLGFTVENFSSKILTSRIVDEGVRVITLHGDKEYILEEELLDKENGVVLVTAYEYGREKSPLENIIGLKELERTVALNSISIDQNINLKSEFLVALERSSYLFQIAGKVVHLDITDSSINTCIESKKLSRTFNAYFDSLYRLIRDDEGTHVFISLTYQNQVLKLASYIENGLVAHQKVEKGAEGILNKLTAIKGELYGFNPQVHLHRFKKHSGFELVLKFEVSDSWDKYFESHEIPSI